MTRNTLGGPATPVTIAGYEDGAGVETALTVGGSDVSSTNPLPTDDLHFNVEGAHSSGATISSATTLTPPAGANRILIQALTQNVRFTLDGTTPTASLGFQLKAGDPPVLISVRDATLKVIEETATASLQYQWGS